MTMKNVFENWRGYQDEPVTIDEQLVIESRYTDAVASTTNWKKIIDKSLLEEVPENYLKNLSDTLAASLKSASKEDPTGKNKYLLWLASALKAYMQKRFKHINPQRAEFDTPEQVASDKEQTLEAISSNVQYIANKFTTLLPTIHELEERNILSNIDQYKDIDELERAVYEGGRELRNREMMDKMKDAAKETSDFLIDDKDISLVRPNSEEASCYFGQGTKWCISSVASGNYFNQYSGEGHVFYFALFRHLPQDSDDKQLALVYKPGDGDEPSEVFDRPDDDVGVEAIYEAARANIFFKGLNRMPFYKKLKKQSDSEQWSKETNSLYEDSMEDLRDAEEHVPLDSFWKTWASQLDIPDSLDTKSMLLEAFDELAQEQAGDILGSSAGHFQDNPGGPSHDDYQKLFDQYDFRNLYVSFDEYDEANYYWTGGWSFDPDIDEYNVDDAENFAAAIEDLLDDNYVHGSVEWDRYDGTVRVEFNTEYDEQNGLDGFERFLERMQEYDRGVEDAVSDPEVLMAAYIKHGAIAPPRAVELSEMLDEMELENFTVEYDKDEVSFIAQLKPTLYIPKWVLETPEPNAVLNDMILFIQKDSTKEMISGRVMGVIEDDISRALDSISAQMELPYDGEKEADDRRQAAWQRAAEEVGFGREDYIDIGIYPRADSLSYAMKNITDSGGAGKYVAIPNDVEKVTNLKWYLSLDLPVAEATDADVKTIEKFARYIDSEKVFSKIVQLLDVTINKVADNVDYEDMVDSNYHVSVTDVQETIERQIHEIHQLLNPLRAPAPDDYREKAETLMREVFNK